VLGQQEPHVAREVAEFLLRRLGHVKLYGRVLRIAEGLPDQPAHFVFEQPERHYAFTPR
jgi:hypothetical protein